MAKTTKPERSASGAKVALYVLVAVILSALVTFFVVKTYVFPSEFKPVKLSVKEERVLKEKLARLDEPSVSVRRKHAIKKEYDKKGNLKPERYSEDAASREITITERELNSMLAKNTDLAKKLAIDLSGELLSAKLLFPVDEDFPIIGGQIIRARAGLELAYKKGRPVVILKGISLMGVPLPNAWMGGIKNVDLAKEYGDGEGFWKAFGAGVADIRVEEGRLKIRLHE